MNIGAGWKKKDRSDKPFLSCTLEIPFLGTQSILIFPVEEKKNDNSPDYRLVWMEKGKQQDQSGGAPTQNIPDEDIPF